MPNSICTVGRLKAPACLVPEVSVHERAVVRWGESVTHKGVCVYVSCMSAYMKSQWLWVRTKMICALSSAFARCYYSVGSVVSVSVCSQATLVIYWTHDLLNKLPVVIVVCVHVWDPLNAPSQPCIGPVNWTCMAPDQTNEEQSTGHLQTVFWRLSST